MASTYAQGFDREFLARVHNDVAQLMISLGGCNHWMAWRHSNKIKAASVTYTRVRGRKHFTVKLDLQAAGQTFASPLFVWEGIAYTAWEARAQAWLAWMAEQERGKQW